MTPDDVWTEAVALEVREVASGGFGEPVREAMTRADELAERYGEDAAREFWGGLQDLWLRPKDPHEAGLSGVKR